MTAPLLSRRPHRQAAALAVFGDITLPLGRLHEACGPARRSFAMLVAAATQGPVYWVAPTWQIERLNPDEIVRFTNPGRFTFLSPKRPEDVLWTLEEVLRNGSVPLVVGDIPGPPNLTAVRRLHLAAETGAGQGYGAPLGLILTPGDGGASGVETRWHMAAAHAPDTRTWILDRRRARAVAPRQWQLTGDPGTRVECRGLVA